MKFFITFTEIKINDSKIIMKSQKKLNSKAVLGRKEPKPRKHQSSESSECTAKPWQEKKCASTVQPEIKVNGTEDKN